MAWWIYFEYNARGAGEIVVEHDNGDRFTWSAATGSIGTYGNLKNAIAPGRWFIIDRPVATTEPGMVTRKGEGWKARLYQPGADGQYIYTHYLIHPDGGLRGSLGCIVTPDSALKLRDLINAILDEQENIAVIISAEETKE